MKRRYSFKIIPDDSRPPKTWVRVTDHKTGAVYLKRAYQTFSIVMNGNRVPLEELKKVKF